jgi:ribosome assembly protein 1
VDPFWRPTTQDELEEFGDVFSGISNVSRTLIDRVRRRKGLAVEEKIVESAEKQRTLKR